MSALAGRNADAAGRFLGLWRQGAVEPVVHFGTWRRYMNQPSLADRDAMQFENGLIPPLAHSKPPRAEIRLRFLGYDNLWHSVRDRPLIREYATRPRVGALPRAR